MKISGFTIVKNARKFNYPVLESIRSILPFCDEFVVNVGDSEDDTLNLIKSLNNPKIRIIQTQWDMSMGKEVLSYQTNVALKECSGDWAFYLQSDEVVHEQDLVILKEAMNNHLKQSDVDALRFKWLHFYGSYWRYRIDAGWYQKQDRIIRNNGTIESFGDAYAFRRRDGKPLRSQQSHAFIYHYGWVQSNEVMATRRYNARDIGFIDKVDHVADGRYVFGDLNRFPVYFGTHPAEMNALAQAHEVSKKDWADIRQRFRWHPFLYLRPRRKTWRRIKEKIC